MKKNIHIKLTKVSNTAGPFDIYDQFGNLIAEDVSREDLINGIGYLLDDSVEYIKLVSTGDCPLERTMKVNVMDKYTFYQTPVSIASTGCLWRHLVNPTVYNTYYGAIERYAIEYPFSCGYFDEITQSVKDYSRVYEYLPNTDGVPSVVEKIEVDDKYFNKLIIYNGNQCSGQLNLIKKPLNNLSSYMSYPKYNSDSKDILYKKSDGFYQVNTFWNLVKDLKIPLFERSCENLSIDKELNQENMEYGKKSFTKSPIRGKETRVRYILDDRGDIHIVSRLFYTSNQISYK